ncbi:hypothetical protein ENKNEFLB_02825 [Nocardioides aquaticus]|uniref:Phage portal protein n=1 Tax=Nocardioides aquaticus TaxID=160826 RepID=A0ABX8EIT3_9ACTN|nr:hypothetical protein ENKNEFLB_02825 [Nocardioides aquaticus]
MGWMWDALRAGPPAVDTDSASTFAVDAESVPPSVIGLESYASATAIAPRVSRREAIQVPAVKRSRDLIVGSLGQLPLSVVKADLSIESASWLQQPERNVPRSVTMSRLVEDLLFEQVAWWRIIESDYRNFPARVKRLKPDEVSLDEDQGKVYVGGKHVPDDELIRFDSPNDALLVAGARAIRQCLLLDQAAQRYADGAPPGDYFTPAEGADPFDDDTEAQSLLLDPWASARKRRSTAWVPAAVNYHTATFNPEQLELADQRQHAVLEIARVAGVDPEELGVSTTSRTYANQFDRRKNFLDFTLGSYRAAVEDRLSMGDVTPRGSLVRFDLDGFLRSSAKERFEAYKLGLEVGAIGPEEIRPAEGKPQLIAERPIAPVRAIGSTPTQRTEETA